MGVHEIKKDHVKLWVVSHASVTNPYKKKWWYASVSIGYDYCEKGLTIEKAYSSLTDFIFKSPNIMARLSNVESFKKIVKTYP